MTTKKPTNGAGTVVNASADEVSTLPKTSASPSFNGTQSVVRNKGFDPSTSALIISRNKHWRYISSFHGPWLQLPSEVLESLAYNNYDSPCPHPIDPAVFFDLVKVRRLVDEATDLAVRAANGTTAASLTTSLSAGKGMPCGGGAAVLGLGIGGGGPNAKLSRERKHRMREQATQKLSQAYKLDEIAASVATMQGASPLEDVAKMVLQRNANDSDAKYVHFFHEKIPSRMLAQCTTLEPLDQVIQDCPMEGAALRTRAVTRIFKDDFIGAAHDLSEALAVCRYTMAQHKAGRGQLELATALGGVGRKNAGVRNWKYEPKIEEADHLSSLETQLLFHRAGVYLTLACQHIYASLDGLAAAQESSISQPESTTDLAERTAHTYRPEARKLVKAYARRALRDYMSFLSHFDYMPGSSTEVTEDFFRKVNAMVSGFGKPARTDRLLEISSSPSLSKGHLSETPVSNERRHAHHDATDGSTDENRYTGLPSPEIYSVSALFSASPPDNLPQYPITSQTIISCKEAQKKLSNNFISHSLARSEQREAVTYHPLLTDALHSLLLCHSLVQTSPTEHLRHAHMVARLARVCDGYPIFLAARSPSRADWIEVVRRANNWIGLQHSWETLCAPAPLPGPVMATKKAETEEQAKERCRQEAVLEALADERVHDEASFQAAVTARERRAEEHRREEVRRGGGSPHRWTQDDGKECPIGTARAEAIARFVKEASLTIASVAKTKRGPKKGKGRREPVHCKQSGASSNCQLDVNIEVKPSAVDEDFDI